MKHRCTIFLTACWLAATCFVLFAAGGLRAADSTNAVLAQSASNDATNLLTRTFKIEDTKTFREGLENGEVIITGEESKQAASHSRSPVQSLDMAVHNFFTSVGVDLAAPKSVFYNETNGTLFVRATRADLAVVEQAIEVLSIKPPQVKIRVQFYAMRETNSAAGFFSEKRGLQTFNTNILSASKSKAFCQLMRSFGDVEVLGSSEVKGASGREMRVSASGARTNAAGSASPAVNVVPYVSADNQTIQLVLIPDFLEKIAESPGEFQSLRNVPDAGTRHPARQITSTAILQSGQTYVWTGRTTGVGSKAVLILVTPTIVDSADNHAEKDESGIYDRYNGSKPLPGEKALQR